MSLISGPHERARKDQLRGHSAAYVVVHDDLGWRDLGKPLTRGEARHGRYSPYFLVSRTSGVQELVFAAPAQGGRDKFELGISFELVVSDPVGLFNHYGADKDPIEPAARIVQDLAASMAAQSPRSEPHQLRERIRAGLKAEVVPYLSIEPLGITVDLSEDTRVRHELDQETLEQKAQLEQALEIELLQDRHQQQLELQRLDLEQQVNRKKIEYRKERIDSIAQDLGIRLDPLMRNALAAEGVPSGEALARLRDQLRGERDDQTQLLAKLVVTLSDANVLEDDRLEAIMRFFDEVVESTGETRRQSVESVELPGPPKALESQPEPDEPAD
ncbi:MAG: hypothetical protein GY788_28355 [bacterium]|nr:hypothetical protein [bacterium]